MQIPNNPRSLNLPYDAWRQHQKEALESIVNSTKKVILLVAPTGSGKCLGRGTPVLLHSGQIRPVEEIKAGDRLMGPDSKHRRVLSTSEGRGELYEIQPVKGQPWIVNSNHVLTLVKTKTGNRWPSDVAGLTVDVPLYKWSEWPRYRKHIFKLFRTGVSFPHQTRKLPVDPYFLGLLLGDGSLHKGIYLTNPDPEIVSEAERQAQTWGLILRRGWRQGALHMHFSSGRTGGRANPLLQTIRKLGLAVSSKAKYIPHAYKTSSRHARLQLLAGLLDTDGHLANGCYDYISASQQLAEDVAFLARSLGLAAYILPCRKSCQNAFTGSYWRVSISGNLSTISCHVEGKKASSRRQKKDVLRTGFRVAQKDRGSYYGLEVDDDGRYLLGDFTVTTNSGIALGAIRALAGTGQGHILTRTISLQQQYHDLFPELTIVKGKDNFNCILPNQEEHTVSEAICQTGWKCFKQDVCPYFVQMRKTRTAKEIVFSYAMWLAGSQEANLFLPPDNLIADEGHELEDAVISSTKILLSAKLCERWKIALPLLLDEKAYADWAGEILPMVLNARRRLAEELGQMGPGRADGLDDEQERMLHNIRELDRITRTLGKIRAAPESGQWFIQTLKNGNLEMVPVWVSAHTSVLFGRSKGKVVVMSATLLPSPKTAKRLGLEEGSYEFIEVPSTFDPTRAPIIIRPVAALNRMNLQEKLPALVKAVDSLLNDHLPDRGIIHTATYRIRDYLLEHSQFGHEMVTHDTRTRLAVIDRFRRMEGQPVIVSPSMGMGFSGDDDICRYQIICKWPFPDMSDPLTRLRQAEDPEAYSYDANSTFIQICGRGMRSETDHAMAYVLDGQIRRQMARYPSHFPKWIRDRIL